MNHVSVDGYWVVVPDFDAASRQDSCSVSGMRKRKKDVGVFRPIQTVIDFEGYFDISQYAVEQAARMLDWKSPEEVAALEQRITDLEGELEMSRAEAFKAAANAVKMAGVRNARK